MTDVDGDMGDLHVTQAPSYGTLTVSPTPTNDSSEWGSRRVYDFTYTITDPSYSGPDQFAIAFDQSAPGAQNPSGDQGLRVFVETDNRAPQCNRPTPSPLRVKEARLGMTIAGIILDCRDVDPLTFTVLEPPAHGTISPDQEPHKFFYNFGPGYTGSDSVTFRATDSTGLFADVVLPIEIEPLPPVAPGPGMTPGPAPATPAQEAALALGGSPATISGFGFGDASTFVPKGTATTVTVGSRPVNLAGLVCPSGCDVTALLSLTLSPTGARSAAAAKPVKLTPSHVRAAKGGVAVIRLSLPSSIRKRVSKAKRATLTAAFTVKVGSKTYRRSRTWRLKLAKT